MTDENWYLGLDFGTNGLSAVLWKVGGEEEYSIYWLSEKEEDKEKFHFRLATVAYYGLKRGQIQPSFRFPFAISPEGGLSPLSSETASISQDSVGIWLENFKPLLQITLPYYDSQERQWQPKLKMLSEKAVSLYLIQRGLQGMFALLTPENVGQKIGGVGLSEDALRGALKRLEGVIISCPAGWNDAYRFNVREALLGAKLVSQPQQIYFVESAIASWLGYISTDSSSSGYTLIIHAGSATTELALVTESEETLNYTDFTLGSLSYGGNGINEDIFWQLLYPQWSQYQESLANLEVEVPFSGQPDLQRRISAYWKLMQHPLGKSALKASQLVKQVLTYREEFSSTVGSYSWKVQQQDLEVRVISPFIEQINQQLNHIVSQAGVSEGAITRVMLTGGTITTILPSLKAWLQQKLVNAELIQPENLTLQTVRGLAQIPRFPQVLNLPQHQYSDYFLLSELLACLPDTPVTVAEVMHLLQLRGINPVAGRDRVLAFLSGELPSGLIPTETDFLMLSDSSQTNLLYQELVAAPLFVKEGTRGYRLNLQQQERLRQYLSKILAGTAQKLDEPLSVNL